MKEARVEVHDNVQILEKMKQLLLFIERNLEEKVVKCITFCKTVYPDIIRLCFFSEPDAPVMGNGSFKSSTLVPGYVTGSVLVGSISYGKLSFAGQHDGKNPEKHPVSHRVSYIIPPNKVDEDKGKNSSLFSKKTVSERLEQEVRDAKVKVLGGLNQGSEEECLEWKELSASLKTEYPKYTPLLAKILEGLVSRSYIKDKFLHHEEIIDAANEVIDSIDREELAKFFSLKNDPEDEEAEKIKKKMDSTRDQLAEALNQKGLALAEIVSLKEVDESLASVATEGAKQDVEKTDEQSKDEGVHPDLFKENFNELKKWVDVKCTKYGILLVTNERRNQRLGTALKIPMFISLPKRDCNKHIFELRNFGEIVVLSVPVDAWYLYMVEDNHGTTAEVVLNDIIQDDPESAKKKFYELKLSLLEEIGWSHFCTYEREWMLVKENPSQEPRRRVLF
ncbi:unnamed protein product [Sphenostylis stenocarpa]|uniref:Uncharacterized protein n=1 Tax=Sphenostylis stenocarpa TaxID=92480 RepID=A0AA87B7A6_9FABA|nr:unnamed protein product [Sphenostylis stenocarpa]